MLIDEALKLVNKFIPDKESQAQFEIEMRKLEVEDFKNKKGSSVEKAVSCLFPLVGVIFCLYLLSNLIGMWRGFFNGGEAYLFPMDEDLYRVMFIYITGFFGKRTVEGWKKEK